MATLATSSRAVSAQDGIDRIPSKDPTVNRPLIVVSPPMAGRDVANLQRAVRTRLQTRGIDVPVPVHGRFTLATALACTEVQYFLGLRSDTYLKKDKHGHRVVTEGAQLVIRDPESREQVQLDRAKERQAQLERGPRFYEELAQELGLTGSGAGNAIAFARKHIGTKEQPAGSNSGPKITPWCRATGYMVAVPWCGCWVNVCVMAGGVPSGAGWIGFTPAIVQHAKAAKGGWSWHTTGKPGDLALFDTPGGPTAVHVGLVEKQLSSSSYQTIEGNTSSGSMGSQDNGGGVFRRTRSTQGMFRIIGFARPPYPA